MKKIFVSTIFLAGACCYSAVTVPTSAPVRPGGMIISGQAEAMPHTSFSAIDATGKGDYDPLEVKVAGQADQKCGKFNIDYYPHFSTPGRKTFFASGPVALSLTENDISLHIGKETFSAPTKFQWAVWYEIELLWQNGSVSVKVDDKELISLKRDILPIADTFILGGNPDGMLRNIILDRPRPCPVQQLNGKPLKFTVRSNNNNYITFDYFAHGAAQKLRVTPRMSVAPGDKFFLIHSAGDPMIITAEKAGELLLDLPESYSNRVEIRRDKGNLLKNAALENYPVNWTAVNVPGYTGNLQDIPVLPTEKPIVPTLNDDRIIAGDALLFNGKKTVIMERNRNTGMLQLVNSGTAIRPDTRYLLTVYHKVLEDSVSGGSLILQVKVMANGKVIQTFRQYNPVTPLRKNGKWTLLPLQFNTRKSNLPLTLQVELISDAAQCKIALADLALREYPNNVYQPMPRDTDRERLLTGQALLDHLNRRQTAEMKPFFPMSGVAGYDGNIYKLMAQCHADIHFIKINIDNRRRVPAWQSDGTYDFSQVDNQLLHALSYAPDANVALMIGIDPALDFGNVYPDAAWRDINDKIVYMNPPDARYYPERKGQKYPYVSFTAPDFRRECGKFLFALGEYLKTKPWGKAVVGIHVFGGGDGQWFYRPRKNDFAEMMDRSPGNLAAMKDAIRKYYRNDVNALRKAWGDEKLTFETITFPTKEAYNRHRFLRDPNDPEARKIIDFIKLYPEVITDTLGFCTTEFERGMGKKLLKSRYYFGTSMGHLLKHSPFDIMVSVPPYGVSRLHGAVGRVHQPPASAVLHKKVYLDELDLRTSYSPVAVYGTSNAIRWNGVEHGPDGFLNMTRKMAAPALTNRQGYWYLTIGGNSSYQYEMGDTIRESFAAAKHDAPTIELDDQIAFFWDEEARTMMGDRFGWSVDQHSTHQGQRVLFQSGVGVQQYLLSDLTHPERKAAKINVFALGTTMTEEQIAFVEKNLQKNGNILVFVFDAGRTAPGGFEKNIRRLTGMDVKSAPNNMTGLAAFGPERFSDPLSRFIKNAAPISAGPFAIPLYYVDDPGAKPLAYLARTGLVGAAVKRHKNWTAVYLSIPLGLAVDPGFFRQLALEAGIVPFAPLGEISYAGNGIIAIHATSDGEKTLQWAEPADVADLATAAIVNGKSEVKIIKKNCQSITIAMKYGETRWFKLLKPQK